MEKMSIYNACRQVPAEAKKQIGGGRLKGFTDINPMWRIKKLTELFGPCGQGWFTNVLEFVTESAGDERCVICRLNLYYKTEEGKWSEPVEGIGGSMVVAKEKSGLYLSDEAYKMAYTDALSVACKALGMAADVYYEKDRTKYDSVPTATPAKATPAKAPAKTTPAKAPAKTTPAKPAINNKQMLQAAERYAKGEVNILDKLMETFVWSDKVEEKFFQTVQQVSTNSK